ncbi:MAG TPA: HAD-IA family hydrolase [Lentimicrobium sp.]|nr:HAD-IA family hydrolase [Lentimicrobium sp.]
MANLEFEAVIFDLDGVITKTALVHSNAWKSMFDEFLLKYSSKHNLPFKEFTHTGDYLPYVDGKPRYKGVQDFLLSRGIELPFGDPSDSQDTETICGLGNRKDYAFNEILKRDGVGVYESTVELIRQLKDNGVRVGVASSSKNCAPVLEAAGLLDLFETRVDGVISAQLRLKGKPEPDIFTTAADNLGVSYENTAIVEDAVSGVQAGRKGDFGLVLGVAREENENELLLNGADLVVTDLSEITLEGLNDWFASGIEDEVWRLTYQEFDPIKERTREALLTIGNGYFGTRGAMEETNASQFHSPGTYVAGLYNRLESKVGDRMVENEDFVNVPNWLPVTFRIDDGQWFDFSSVKFLEFNKTLDFRNGVFSRKIVFEDTLGRITALDSHRLASMQNPHLAALQYSITPLNYTGRITIRSGINGNIINEGVERYKQLNQKHLKPDEEGYQGNTIYVSVETSQSAIKIAEAATHRIFLEEHELMLEARTEITPACAYQEFAYNVIQGQTVVLEKIVSIYTSKHDDTENPVKEALKLVSLPNRFSEIESVSEQAWKELWDKIDVRVDGSRTDQKLLRLHLYHLMVSASPHNKSIDASFTARGLHGEAYRGHIFWDELFILPFYNLHLPETARATLMYRYRRLAKAKEYASEYGFRGAMYPWQSGSDGREETQIVHLNPLTGHWGDDYSSLQRHVSLAIAYNIWEYYNATNDLEFLSKYGAEMFFEICRFWESKSIFNSETGRYSITGVMGPDEFHEQYPDSDSGGLRDNAYTNILAAWAFRKAAEINQLIKDNADNSQKIVVSSTELKKWEEISGKLNLVISDDGIIAQYDGYFELKELDWDYYKSKYGNIYRLDRILKAEGKSADEYKVAKQADTLMIFYILEEKEVRNIIESMGYHVEDDFLKKNMEYYLARTSHGSTLSRVVHAQLANMIDDTELSRVLYQDALCSDFNDIQGGTTAEGIHLGVMAGTIMIALQSYAGLKISGDQLMLQPKLPKTWKGMNFNITYKAHHYTVNVAGNKAEIIKV